MSHKPINVGNEEKEGQNRRDIIKIGREWNNHKECGGFSDGWDCCLLEIIVSR